MKYLRTLAYNDLPLVDELSAAPLIPIILSHGLTGNRTIYQLNGQELASHGYIVFMMDHLDGSNMKTTTKSGKSYVFDCKQPYFMLDFKLMTEETERSRKHWRKCIDIRVKEVTDLIDEVSEEGFL